MPKMPELTRCCDGSPHDLERLNCVDRRTAENEMLSIVISLYCRKCGTQWDTEELWPEPVAETPPEPGAPAITKKVWSTLERLLTEARMRALDETPDGIQAKEEVEALVALLTEGEPPQKPPEDA